MDIFEMIILGIPAILIIGIFVVFVWFAIKQIRRQKAGFSVKDERTMIQGGKAAYLTVLASLYFMLMLMYYIFLSESLIPGLPVLDTAWYMIFALIFESVLFLTLIYYFNSKGA